MKVALAQINTVVGDFENNVRKICSFIERAKRKHADLVVFPELAVTGYPPKDFLDIPAFVSHNLKALRDITQQVSGIAAIVGFVDRNRQSYGKLVHNAAAFIQDRQIVSVHHKSLLPTYDVFDESRYFESACSITPVQFNNYTLGISICEDIWNDEEFWTRPLYETDPIEKLISKGANVIINISASPFTVEKHESIRLRMLTHDAKKYKVPFIYVNQIGGNDELVFDGSSAVINAQGKRIAQAAAFGEDLIVVDLENTATQVVPQTFTPIETVQKALLLGLRDYVVKCGFEKVIIGLSGGIDSAVTAALAVEALGSENVMGIIMPSQFSSQGSVDDAVQLSKNLAIDYRIFPIKDLFDGYQTILREEFRGLPFDIAEENLQARIRGNIIMTLSNKYGYLVLSTGNKSEMAVGYCTLYGDMNGGLALISDVPKTMVYELAKYMNREKEIIPQETLSKPPSAELRPNQLDQDSLPPYNILDSILKAYIEEAKCIEEIVRMGFDETTVRDVIQKVNRNEYKRRQAAPGIKVTSKAFGSGRRMPIAHKFTGE
ncbi:glutamine-dependent NAD(+) synthetase [Candidatus Kuenenia stuttgartiensis]|jgi:NAD+ synthase (glutamine-hydrolysing)|uniref:Glutamine-dependent NAD(+) synthetase n=1 Tax=Kuenenia stuttgartiensis TaxID=174633 RepID=Q1Q210_KUEST|nr:NAD+ synthase [Candidatus Kuenenia stuttgartiensis]MCF6153152.1 NAD+ synthase [Candidatus Kuenenia stuttgartiensis]QII11069.1 glutamine-dependent NAD(+) synthetase [Candidatus Kuenenia stuttgartiensis]CAJ74038.1 similar to NAD synthase [Candidatus Kuenenia stuttgartiensis]